MKRFRENVVPEIPTKPVVCSGEWLDGSGGHRKHGPCDKPATHYRGISLWAYCDEHIKLFEKRFYQFNKYGWEDLEEEANHWLACMKNKEEFVPREVKPKKEYY